MQHGSLWDRIWKDKHGKVVIWQFPNAFLIGWAVLTFLSLFTSSKSQVGNILSDLGSASLIIWSLLEIFKGVNYFRRILGLVVLVAAVMSLIKNISS